MTYRCATCGETHDDLPDLGADRPDPWWSVPESERESRIRLTSDTCVIDDEHHFIRGVIEIPINDGDRSLGFGVWVSLKRENFELYESRFNSSEIGPYFGWLCTRLGCYSQTTHHLKTMAHFRGGGLRPSIELEPTDHPLAVDQRDGITLDQAWKYVHHFTANGGSDQTATRHSAAGVPGRSVSLIRTILVTLVLLVATVGLFVVFEIVMQPDSAGRTAFANVVWCVTGLLAVALWVRHFRRRSRC